MNTHEKLKKDVTIKDNKKKLLTNYIKILS